MRTQDEEIKVGYGELMSSCDLFLGATFICFCISISFPLFYSPCSFVIFAPFEIVHWCKRLIYVMHYNWCWRNVEIWILIQVREERVVYWYTFRFPWHNCPLVGAILLSFCCVFLAYLPVLIDARVVEMSSTHLPVPLHTVLTPDEQRSPTDGKSSYVFFGLLSWGGGYSIACKDVHVIN